MKELPDNVTEFGKNILMDIATGTQPLPLPEYFNNIIEKLDRSKINSTIRDIRDHFCNKVTTMDAIKFKFFEPWLREQGELENRMGDAVDRIIKPIINIDECRALIFQNEIFYTSLINKSGDHSYDLKESFRQNIKGTSDEKLISFANGIGIFFDSEK